MITRTPGRRVGRRLTGASLVASLVVVTLAGGAGPALAGAGTIGPTVPAPAPVVPELPDRATDAGELVVVSAANTEDELTDGDTNTVFAVRLPAGSVCPGDSANDEWRVQSFIVPAETDLGSLVYGATRPRGDLMYGLYTTEGRPYVQVLLAQNPEPGLPGQILAPPAMSFAPFTPDLLPVGRYRIGVACSYFEVGERYWDAEIELTEDRDVQPGERRWSVVAADGTTTTPSVDGAGTNPLTVVAALVAAVGAVAFLTIRRRRTPALVKEQAR
jgi:hypothetical protein